MRNIEAPAQTFVVRAEAHAADAKRIRVQGELGWRVRLPEPLECFEL